MATSDSTDSLDNCRVKFAEKDSEDKDIGEGEILADVNGNGSSQGETTSLISSSTTSLEGIRGSSLHGDTDSEDDFLDDDGQGTYARIIVIGIDGSAEAYHSFHWYISNMHVDGNFVVLLHVFALPLLSSYQEMYVSPEMWSSTLRREAKATTNMEKRLKGVLHKCRIPGKFIARGGRPGEVLVKVAEEEDADLIVIGTKGHSRLHRAFLGSVSSYVTKNAPCSVTVCRHKGKRLHKSPSTSRSRRTSSSSSGSFGKMYDDEASPRPGRVRHNSTSSATNLGLNKSKKFLQGLWSRKRTQSTSASLDVKGKEGDKGENTEKKSEKKTESKGNIAEENVKEDDNEANKPTSERILASEKGDGK